MVAGLTAMKLFDHKAIEKVNLLALRTKELITHSIEKVGIKACVTGEGAMLRVHFKSLPPTNYRQSFLNEDEAKALKIMLTHANEQGIMLINTCSMMLSTVMTINEIKQLVDVLEQGFELVTQQLPSFRR